MDITTYLETKNTNQTSEIDTLRADLAEMERKYKAQVQQNSDLAIVEVAVMSQFSDYKKSYDTIAAQKDDLERQLRELPLIFPSSPDNVAVIQTKVRICPDDEAFRITGGEYNFDPLVLRQAHVFSKQKLERVLLRPVPKRLYIPIGRPASGKTTWIEQHKPPGDRLSIYYDATNATSADRWELLNLSRLSANTIVSYVYFEIDIDSCIRNNASRMGKAITADYIRHFTVELPEIDEGYDELIVIRR